MVAEGARERRSKLRMAEQRQSAAKSRWHKDRTCEQDNVSHSHPKETKPTTRTEIAARPRCRNGNCALTLPHAGPRLAP